MTSKSRTSEIRLNVSSKTQSPALRDAVKYGRVSSKEQEKEGFSIPAQWKLLDQYAKTEGCRIVREFIDIESAKKPGRPGFEQMIKFLKRSSVRVLLVEKTDRLYRNLKDYVTMDEKRQIRLLPLHGQQRKVSRTLRA